MKETLKKIALTMMAVMFVITPAFALALPVQAQTASGDLDFGQSYAQDIGLTE